MISVMTPNHFLKNIIKKYHLKYINVHGIRHTVASLLSQSGIPVKQVQLQLGDADVSVVLNTYTHVDDALKKRND
ncbi:tyrosine-type recombinase/integrase [Secundilactobacillus silagei]|uniref:tyrosine-type recombinase/integrase n=1 Tax=Secundilactobacillus silagei TaxID=1293415 RepID=UPI0025B0A2E4|nr:tyrosine-type recombinase/integrase [Secundilactobacillus silagei]